MPLIPLRFRRDPKTPWRPRPISTWVLFWASVVVLVGGTVYYLIQVSLINAIDPGGSADTAIAITQLRVDTVRNTLTVAAGLGGAAALVLSFRRQQHEEYHSTQQRITELRIQAVAQLGSESPTVRIGGLHNLERLGEQHEELRQIVLDEICSYLRLPYSPPKASRAGEATPTEDDIIKSAEREVRLIAQEILQRKLKPRSFDDMRAAWEHDRINLRNAFLDDIDFTNCRLHDADFSNAVFNGIARFSNATFISVNTKFRGAVFRSYADFRSSKFRGPWIHLSPAASGRAGFTGASFNSDANFRGARFGGAADFDRAIFKRTVDLRDATLGRTPMALDARTGQWTRSDGELPRGWQIATEPDGDGLWKILPETSEVPTQAAKGSVG